jgi:hypothetical protein
MTTAQDVLERHFPGLTPGEVDAELSRTPAAGATPIAAAAMEYLAEHGGEEARAALAHYDPARVAHTQTLTAAQDLEHLLRSSLSIEDAAAALRVSRSRISHRLKAQSIYAFTVQGRRYVPSWQFRIPTGGGKAEVIPGLAQVVPAIPRDLHPLALEAFMTTPLPDLDGKSPVEHLSTGGVIEVVTDWLTSLGHR